jgi:4a-hydroxytetrahydrobiopterin dehydratase
MPVEAALRMALRDDRCEACTGATPLLTSDELTRLHAELDPAWELASSGTRLRRTLGFPDFATAFALATHIALIAQEQGHHPDMTVGWGRLVVEITTHAVGGLTRNDVVFAAHVDVAVERMKA